MVRNNSPSGQLVGSLRRMRASPGSRRRGLPPGEKRQNPIRPPKGEYPEKKRVFASRVREDTWAKLQQASAKSGRSVSQEFEHQLRRALDEGEKIESAFGDLRTYALMKLAAQAV